MFHVILYEPEIPPNTGNIMRLCANAGAALHLIHPLGFSLNEKSLRRAGLDYRDWVNVKEYKHFDDFKTQIQPHQIFACTTKGKQNYTAISYHPNDAFLFGPETRGLPIALLNQFEQHQKIRIPMKTAKRSLNLSNAVAIILFEAWRQVGFC